MSGMTGASMLRTRRKDVNVKPNRKLDRKSSRGMLYENEELRLRTININAEVERGQSDIKKLKRENEQLKREISALRYEYDRLDSMLRERRSSPEHSDDSASVSSACPECASVDSARAVAFHDLSVVPEEAEEGNKSGVESPCTCEECRNDATTEAAPRQDSEDVTSQNMERLNNVDSRPKLEDNGHERTVDVIIHDAPDMPRYFQSVTSSPCHVLAPPPPGFVLAPAPLPPAAAATATALHTTYIQQNSVIMCNTRHVLQRQCCCQTPHTLAPLAPHAPTDQPPVDTQPPKSYVTEKNIELTYDYPRSTPVPSNSSPKSGDELTTTTEVASTVVFVERRIPVKPKKFDFFFRSRSAPVGDHEEPIYATVNKLPKRLRRMELANLEKEVAYRAAEPDSSVRTEVTLKTDSESQAPPPDDDTSRSEREKSSAPQRPESPKAKKRKRFSLTFKKRERKRRDKKKEAKNGAAKNGVQAPLESDNERLLEGAGEGEGARARRCSRHRPRASTAGPRYKRDSYQEMTTSHSEHERTNSVCSSMNSLGSACTHKSRKLSAAPQDGAIPWCGCWGAGCV
ncbi:PREDICTED: uncharacterized protein LOC106123155 isoform X2 [Papilio xuthus]|nr:PREDICTED: uncharacterized protein LOC106123155 isoform X2 [Papilio xuthus]XP_013174804.1 PREDICTED: uncharacterized protein LOC106123155 isoform X2 [Papilio xuthus]XP_013174805.1 PREDICTED: uncharacterized protein LOC106123155 isoform X2 [Papilio xuthus]XP_013174806.1 PREDICTED: uncharacterized protein LOC106123155 isoform X2 [Papilio xuthus]